jgi:hypothetical protein
MLTSTFGVGQARLHAWKLAAGAAWTGMGRRKVLAPEMWAVGAVLIPVVRQGISEEEVAEGEGLLVPERGDCGEHHFLLGVVLLVVIAH